MRCAECGAATGGEPCAERWSRLLALDHSRVEPWGSRHALAFAAYHLQHPALKPDVLERCWAIVWAVCRLDLELARVTKALQRWGRDAMVEWEIPPLPEAPLAGGPYTATIADLGAFEAPDYPGAVLAWAEATLDRWARPG